MAGMAPHTRPLRRPPGTHAPPGRARWHLGLLLCIAAMLTACGSLKLHSAASSAPTPPAASAAEAPAPSTSGHPSRATSRRHAPQRQAQRDPHAATPPTLADTLPRDEAFSDWANRPYVVKGQSFTPLRDDVALVQQGVASWYGEPFHGRLTANGERYDMHRFTAAHKTMPLPSYARVTNRLNGRSVIVRVNDRGPFVGDRVIDLSKAAAQRLGVQGIAHVTVERLTRRAIRSGLWRRENLGPSVAVVP